MIATIAVVWLMVPTAVAAHEWGSLVWVLWGVAAAVAAGASTSTR